MTLDFSIIGPALKGKRANAPFFMKLLQWPLLRRIPGRVLALGVRPEHIHTPEVTPPVQKAAA